MVSQNLGRVSLVPRGDWEEGVAYRRLDLVGDGAGSSYIARRDNSDPLTVAGSWMLVAARGQALTFEMLTPEQVSELQRPAAEAAARIDETNEAYKRQVKDQEASFSQAQEARSKAFEDAQSSREADFSESQSQRQQAFERSERERDAGEAERIEAERGRETAEEARASAETSRESAESERKSAEEKRERDFASAKAAADSAAASATAEASKAESAAAAATTAAGEANTAAGKADAATTSASAAAASANEAASKANSAAEAVSMATAGLSPEQLRAMVRLGTASRVLRPGDQISVPWKWGSYDLVLPFDVLHHFDGSDDAHPLLELADGSMVPAMMLGSHFYVPTGCQFDAKNALYLSEGGMPAGTYHLTVEVTVVWGTGISAAVGSTDYQFTLTKDAPAGSQLVWNAGYGEKPTAVQVFSGFSSSTPAETCAVTEGSGGTSLGTLTEVGSTEGMGNIQRSCYGSNRAKTSGGMAWLNARGTGWDSQRTPLSRPHSLAASPGFMSGFGDDFLGVLAPVLRRQESHPCDGGQVDEFPATFFPTTNREHYFNNYLSGTTAGYEAEGVPLDYWADLAAASGRTSPWQGWQTYPKLTTYSAADRTTASGYVWSGSAGRNASSAANEGCVTPSGNLTSTSASSGGVFAPACAIW